VLFSYRVSRTERADSDYGDDMSRHPDTVITRNTDLRAARLNVMSPVRAGRRMNRAEFADRLNAEISRLYPGRRDLAVVTGDYIGKLERGEIRWPGVERRLAILNVLGVDRIDLLGLHPPRDTPETTIEGANLAFLGRAVRVIAVEGGVRQYVCIGCGLPPADLMHEIATVLPAKSCLLYADSDRDDLPATQVRTGVDIVHVTINPGDPAALLGDPRLSVLDLSQPVGLLMVAALEPVHDDATAALAVKKLAGALAPGSYLVVSNSTMDHATVRQRAVFEQMSASGAVGARARPRSQIEGWLADLDLLPPGIVSVTGWRRDDTHEPPAGTDITGYAAVARIP
jgi:hypothetical protein